MAAMKVRLAISMLCIMVLAGASVIEAPANEVFVTDADTIVVKSTKVRFDGIDAPERGHPAYAAGIKFLVNAIWNADSVRCELTGAKTHGREVGTCFMMADGVEANLLSMVVAAGLARDCPRFSGGRYAAFETDASRALPVAGFCVPR